MTRRRAWLWGAALGALVLLGGLGVRFGPAATLTLALAAPPVEAWLAPFLGDALREETAFASGGREVRADVYRPSRPRGGLLLVHGLSAAGRRHPELVRLARLLARHGQLVLVPHVEGLAAFRLTGREVEEVRDALIHLRRLHGSVGVAGFSFGAGPALLAAAEVPGLRVAGSFGGYADLRNVIAFITTGVHAFEGRRAVQPQEEYNRWKLLALLVPFAGDPRDRERLETIARRRLADPSDDTGAVEAALGEGGRSLMALVLNRREEAVAGLLDRLPAAARAALEALSPLAAVGRFDGRLLVAHGADDPSIPFTESLRLAQAARRPARVAILRTFHHTGPGGGWRSLVERALDGWRLLRIADDLLAG